MRSRGSRPHFLLSETPGTSRILTSTSQPFSNSCPTLGCAVATLPRLTVHIFASYSPTNIGPSSGCLTRSGTRTLWLCSPCTQTPRPRATPTAPSSRANHAKRVHVNCMRWDVHCLRNTNCRAVPHSGARNVRMDSQRERKMRRTTKIVRTRLSAPHALGTLFSLHADLRVQLHAQLEHLRVERGLSYQRHGGLFHTQRGDPP